MLTPFSEVPPDSFESAKEGLMTQFEQLLRQRFAGGKVPTNML